MRFGLTPDATAWCVHNTSRWNRTSRSSLNGDRTANHWTWRLVQWLTAYGSIVDQKPATGDRERGDPRRYRPAGWELKKGGIENGDGHDYQVHAALQRGASRRNCLFKYIARKIYRPLLLCALRCWLLPAFGGFPHAGSLECFAELGGITETQRAAIGDHRETASERPPHPLFPRSRKSCPSYHRAPMRARAWHLALALWKAYSWHCARS